MVTITKLRHDYFKVNEKYIRIKEGSLIFSNGEAFTEIEKKCFEDFRKKIEDGLKISKTVTS